MTCQTVIVGADESADSIAIPALDAARETLPVAAGGRGVVRDLVRAGQCRGVVGRQESLGAILRGGATVVVVASPRRGDVAAGHDGGARVVRFSRGVSDELGRAAHGHGFARKNVRAPAAVVAG